MLKRGTPYFVKLEIENHSSLLPCGPGLPSLQSGTRSEFPSITTHHVRKYTKAYFHSFNACRPILDYDTFSNDIVGKVLREGFVEGDPQIVVALLVFALGQVAIEGTYSQPLFTRHSKPSGLRGGTRAEPPGIQMFNEARRRLGSVLDSGTLENVQVLLLQATYYETNCRHVDFWRSTVAASTECQILIKSRQADPPAQNGDLTIRAYWACILNEELHHLDLDLPQTGIHALQDDTPLPDFHKSQTSLQQNVSDFPLIQYHFLALITLRRLVVSVNEAVHQSSSAHAEISDDYAGPPHAVIIELSRQLDSWRALLPEAIRWHDNDKFAGFDSGTVGQHPGKPPFSVDKGTVPTGYSSNIDILTAELRTRFYYARHMLYRPFVYKVLHFPELMSTDDRNCCVLAVQAACLWPIFMAPTRDKKRLVPHLFAWTNSSIGVLLILRMIRVNEDLRGVCGGRVSEQELDETAALILDWLKDIKQVDTTAQWALTVFEPMFEAGNAAK